MWSDADVLPTRVNPYQHLMTRVDPKQLDALFDVEPVERGADAGKARWRQGGAPGAAAQLAAPKRRHRGSATARPHGSDAGAGGDGGADGAATISIDEFKQDRPARGADRQCRARRRRRQAVEADAGSRDSKPAPCLPGIKSAYDPAS